MKHTLTIGLVLLAIFIIAVIIRLNNQVKTYSTALDNTLDATIMEIDNLKGQIRARETASERDRTTIKAKLCKKIEKNMPYRLIDDGTCE